MTPIYLASKIDPLVKAGDDVICKILQLRHELEAIEIPFPDGDCLNELYYQCHQALSEYVKTNHNDIYQKACGMHEEAQKKLGRSGFQKSEIA